MQCKCNPPAGNVMLLSAGNVILVHHLSAGRAINFHIPLCRKCYVGSPACRKWFPGIQDASPSLSRQGPHRLASSNLESTIPKLSPFQTAIQKGNRIRKKSPVLLDSDLEICKISRLWKDLDSLYPFPSPSGDE
jgi:hypothetical protein